MTKITTTTETFLPQKRLEEEEKASTVRETKTERAPCPNQRGNTAEVGRRTLRLS